VSELFETLSLFLLGLALLVHLIQHKGEQMSKSTLRRLSTQMSDAEAMKFLVQYFPCVASMQSENAALKQALAFVRSCKEAHGHIDWAIVDALLKGADDE